MGDQLFIEFAPTEGCASVLRSGGESLQDLLVRLQNTSNFLYSSGLAGVFLADLQARTQGMVDQLRQIADETSEAGRDLQTVVEWSRRVDEECRLGFEQSSAAAGDSYGFFDWVKDGYTFVNDIDKNRSIRARLIGGLDNWLLDNNPEAKPEWMRFLHSGGYRAIGSGFQFGEGVLNALAEGDPSELLKGTLNAGGFYVIGNLWGGRVFTLFDKISGGLVDAATTGDISKLGEGAVEGLVYIIPGVKDVMVVNAGVQFVGHAVTGLADMGADYLAGGNAVQAAEIRLQADELNTALEKADLTNVVDSLSTHIVDIVQGEDIATNLAEIGTDAGGTLQGLGNVVGESADLFGSIFGR